mmetsp:Transcript_34255/g.107309  ORF Transcript_34255/g.107309 Transcript_34255/m.107309 type:complete len:205 (+) Transcript_34255:2385-2999(+)
MIRTRSERGSHSLGKLLHCLQVHVLPCHRCDFCLHLLLHASSNELTRSLVRCSCRRRLHQAHVLVSVHGVESDRDGLYPRLSEIRDYVPSMHHIPQPVSVEPQLDALDVAVLHSLQHLRALQQGREPQRRLAYPRKDDAFVLPFLIELLLDCLQHLRRLGHLARRKRSESRLEREGGSARRHERAAVRLVQQANIQPPTDAVHH